MAHTIEYRPIRTEQDALKWFVELVRDHGLVLHPDTRASEYEHMVTHERTYTDEQAETFDRMMDEAFEACDDVYTTATRAFERVHGQGA